MLFVIFCIFLLMYVYYTMSLCTDYNMRGILPDDTRKCLVCGVAQFYKRGLKYASIEHAKMPIASTGRTNLSLQRVLAKLSFMSRAKQISDLQPPRNPASTLYHN